MRLRSKGLGRREMVMDFREYEVLVEGDELVVVGIIRDPVTWDFSIRFCEDDYPAIFKLAFHPQTLKAVFRALFNRFRKHHWGKERNQHQLEGRESRAEVLRTVDERVQNALRPFDAPTKTLRRTRNGLVAADEGQEIEAAA
ncbi:MAG: hypothetical protein KUL75_03200 [Sterolibacterium sp.]|nr:hypothetical protein [Sterolibacterium sp.]